MKRLEIWSADLSRIDGSHVQQGFRPILLISNDRAAILLMNALRALGYRIPEDIGIVGFDDMEISTMVMPCLTTLHIAKKNMGMKAVQTLQWRLQNRKAKPEKIILPVDLVLRDSVWDKQK